MVLVDSLMKCAVDVRYSRVGVVFRRNELKLPLVKLRYVFIEVGG